MRWSETGLWGLMSLGLVACGPTLEVGELDGTDGGTGESDSTPDESGGEGTQDGDLSDAGTSETGSNPDTGSDDGGVFIDPDIGSCSCCDIWAQDCPAGSKCQPWSNDGTSTWNSTRCSPIADNSKGAGDDCAVEGHAYSGIDDCAKGTICWDVDPTTKRGRCMPLCIGSPDDPACADPMRYCSISSNEFLALCLPTCDPVLQDCEEADQCICQGELCTCVVDASQEGMGNAGDPCEFANVCQKGLGCVAGSLVPGCTADYCCAEFCSIDEPNTCTQAAQGAQCTTLWEADPPYGLDHVGMCCLPQ